MATSSKPSVEDEFEYISDDGSRGFGQLGNKKRDQNPKEARSGPKMDFPKFDGKDIQGWMIKAEQYLELGRTKRLSQP